jgi:hypothetical protein
MKAEKNIVSEAAKKIIFFVRGEKCANNKKIAIAILYTMSPLVSAGVSQNGRNPAL